MLRKKIKDLPNELNQQKLKLLAEAQIKLCGLSLEQMYNFIVDEIIEATGARRCSIFKVSGTQEEAVLIAGKPEGKHGINMRFFSGQLKCLEEVIKTKRPCYVEFPFEDERTQPTRELIKDEHINKILWVPLKTKDEVVSIIVVEPTDEKKELTKEDIAFCRLLSFFASSYLKRDIAEDKKAEEEAMKILSRAALEFAHQIRNPLTVIGGFARRIIKGKEEIKDRALIKKLGIISKEVDRLEKIAKEFLNISLDKGEVALSSVNQLLREAADNVLIEENIKAKKIYLDIKFDEKIPDILINPLKIYGAFHNILQNAIEAIEDSGTIYVRSRMEDSLVRISISNTGGRIEEKHKDRIFDPFYTTKPHGTGLGLAIAEAAVLVHNGMIEFENPFPNQTMFIIKIPFC